MALLHKLFGTSLAKRFTPPPVPSYQRVTFTPDLSRPCDNSLGQVPPCPLVAKPPHILLCTLRHNPNEDPAKLDTKTGFCNDGFLDRLAPDQAKAVPLSLFFWDADTGVKRAAGEAAYGHQGLASYIYTCWAQEKGVVLRPDMIWSTVCYEFSRAVEFSPDTFRKLFTDSSKEGGKQTLAIQSDKEDDLPLDRLMSALDAVIPSKQLKAAITDNHFAGSAPAGCAEAMAACFASAATPFYDYVTYRCGIPHYCILGDRAEWVLLARKCSELASIVPGSFSGYLKNVSKLVGDMIDYTFADLSKESNRIEAETFFSACFWITAACGSGHPYYCRGWLEQLYYSSVLPANTQAGRPGVVLRRFADIKAFPTHMGLVPWKNLESGRMFCSSTGLLYSVLSADGKFLIPCYGQLKYEITDETVFNKLAKK